MSAESMAKTVTFHFGPQHPAAHGVLRLLLTVEGEVVRRADPHIGLLHRATEKLVESKPYIHNIGYMDRLDYVSMMCNEHAYVLAIEKLLGIAVPTRAQYIRTMFDEITRILNHLMVIGATGIDLGALTPILYTFREREVLLDCYEAVSGARMHANYYRPGGVARDLPNRMPQYADSPWRDPEEIRQRNANRQGSLLDYIIDFCESFPSKLDDYETLMTENRIWKQRTVDIGIMSAEEAIARGFSGPNLRASGVAWDLRKVDPYAAYDQVSFRVPVGKQGDCYDRYLVRIAEMRESVQIIRQCADWLASNPGAVMHDDYKLRPPRREDMKQDMEALIHHFKWYTEGFCTPVGQVYAAVEQPKGEFGVYLVSDGANKPYRMKIRAAGFPHLQAMHALTEGHMISDVVAILSSIDIVFGEIDR